MEQGGEGGARLLPRVLVTRPFSKKDRSDFLGAFVFASWSIWEGAEWLKKIGGRLNPVTWGLFLCSSQTLSSATLKS